MQLTRDRSGLWLTALLLSISLAAAYGQQAR
jgi:hypothetical protein